MRLSRCLSGAAAGIATLALSILQCLGQPGHALRPITMIVPFPAGGPSDTIARITADSMAKTLGQTIIIENVAGAGGTLGTARAVRASPDGNTLLLHHIGLATAATLYRQLPYDTRTGLVPIGLVTEAPMTIVGRSDLAPNTMAELIEYLRTRGDSATLAHAGLGSASQLCGLLLMSALRRSVTAVPYKGGAPLMNDLLARQVDIACDQATSSIAQIAAKKVKAYAVTVDERLKLLPDVPTVAEAGLKGFSVSVWHGVYAPRGTPSEVVRRISIALNAALSDADVAKRFGELSTDPVAMDRRTPQALSQMLISEIDRWGPIIKAAGQFAD